MVSLQKQREAQIKQLVAWVKAEYPKILQKVKKRKYYYFNEETDEHMNLSLDNLFKVDKNEVWMFVGAKVFKTLREYITSTFLWSDKTKLDYTRTVMRVLGCKFVDHRWYCPLKVD